MHLSEAVFFLSVQGRNLSAVNDILHSIVEYNGACSEAKQVRVSVELEKVFVGDVPNKLHCYADLVLIGKDYAKCLGCSTSQEACVKLSKETKEGALIVCAWGADGASGRDASGEVFHVPAFPPPKLVNTVGAGDTFNASVVHQLVSGKPLKDAVTFACKVAGVKCGLDGYEDLRAELDLISLQ
jgi:ketohexokinase